MIELEPGWLGRQAAKAKDDIRYWPDWMKRGARCSQDVIDFDPRQEVERLTALVEEYRTKVELLCQTLCELRTDHRKAKIDAALAVVQNLREADDE